MDEIADLCDQRHEEMRSDSRGVDLMSLTSWPHAADIDSRQAAFNPNNSKGTATPAEIVSQEMPRRQDHDQVLLSCFGRAYVDCVA
jgi:hypothetical protein